MKILFSPLKYIYLVNSARARKELSLPWFNQLVQISGSTCFFLLHLFSFQFIISKFNFVGWSRGELWILIATFQIFTYLSFYLFWRGFIWTVRDISSGAFDLLLTKPKTTRFTAFFRSGGTHNLFTTSMGLILLIIAIFRYQINIHPLGLVLYIPSLLSSLWIIQCLGVSFISLNFKFGRLDSTVGAVYQAQEAYKYPSTAYAKSSFFIWLILSGLSLMTTLPTMFLLSKPIHSGYLILYAFLLLGTTYIADKSWASGLRHYSSASS